MMSAECVHRHCGGDRPARPPEALRSLTIANEIEEKKNVNVAPTLTGVLFERKSRRLAAKKNRREMLKNEIGEDMRKE